MSIDTQTLIHLQKLFRKPRIIDKLQKKPIDTVQEAKKQDQLIEATSTRHPLLDVEFSELHHLFEVAEEASHSSFITPLFIPLKNKANDALLIKRKPENITKILIEHKIKAIEATLQCQGILKMTRDGFVYLKVDDAFLEILTPCFQVEGGQKPPFFESYFNPGAHIGVMTREEVLKYSLKGSIEEIGEPFSFDIKGCSQIELSKTSPFEFLWVLHIHSPSIEWLREKYHLPKWYLSREFMMILATKNREDFGKESLKEDVQYVVNPCANTV